MTTKEDGTASGAVDTKIGRRRRKVIAASPDVPASVEPARVVIVGGGCAGIAAAWQLSKQPGYRVTVYERSFRLGGKGASGRDAEGRILEHGLHIWLGFYENAFRMMRECYDEVEARGWGPAGRVPMAHGKMSEAFVAEPSIGVGIPPSAGCSDWTFWTGELPVTPAMPGEPFSARSNPFTLASYLERCIDLIKTLHTSVVAPPSTPDAPIDRLDTAALGAALGSALAPHGSPTAVLDWMTQTLRSATLTAAAVLLQAATILEQAVERLGGLATAGRGAIELILAVLGQVRLLLGDVVTIDPDLRRRTEVIDIVITIGVGLYRDRVLFEASGFDAINHLDYRAWLRRHGASDAALESRFLTGIYDLAFAYRGGDRTTPALAAGVALRGALRMFLSFRGAMFWRMRSGMGDAMFAPLYRVLEARGVEFRLLHTLESAKFEQRDGETFVTSLTFASDGGEALERGGALDHFGCWPAQGPATANAADGRRVVDLQVGDDFEAAIIAAGVDDFVTLASRSSVAGTELTALPGDSGNFFAAMPGEWTDVRRHVATVATQAAQVWLTRDISELGWRRGAGIVTALASPFETVADMTVTIASERAWRARASLVMTNNEPAAVAYFCGVLPEAELGPKGSRDAAAIEAKVAANVRTLLTTGVAPLWPAAFVTGTALDVQSGDWHAQANWHASDRYTLSLPDTLRHRISPLDRHFANLTIAGDWTANGLDAGCVEAAVMSGMLAAHAITGTPALNDIIGFDHP